MGAVPGMQNFPTLLTRFIGRARDLDAAVDAVQAQRLVTVTGPGGVGKTRLAIEAATRLGAAFADGVWFVDLASAGGDPLAAISQVLGAAGRDELPNRLSGRDILLLLDGCEHALDAALFAEPGVRVLATSREPLHLKGEAVVRLAPMTDDDAVLLFVDRAALARQDLVLDDASRPAAASACASVDRLPLGIELAAAWASVLPLDAIASSLERSTTLLVSRDRDVDPRQRTMTATVDWSYRRLAQSTQAAFRHFAIAPAGFTIAAAAALLDASAEEAIAEVTRLVDASLIAVTADRYTMLEVVRRFGLELLDRAGEHDDAGQRLLGVCTAIVADAAAVVDSGRAARVAFRRVARELANCRAALEWVAEHLPQSTLALELAAALAPFWIAQGRLAEGRHWLDALAADASPPDLMVRVEIARGDLEVAAGDFTAARRSFERALVVAREVDTAAVAAVLGRLGGAEWRLGDTAAAKSTLDAALDACDRADATATRRDVLVDLAWVTYGLGDRAGGLAAAREALAASRVAGDDGQTARALSALGQFLFDAGDLDGADAAYRECADLLEAQESRSVTLPLLYLGRIARARGDRAGALRTYERALDIARGGGSVAEEAGIRMGLANVVLELGRPEDALSDYDACLRLYRRSGLTDGIVTALLNMADAHRQLGQLDQAASLLSEALDLTRPTGQQGRLFDALLDLGRVMCARGDRSTGGRYLREALEVAIAVDDTALLAAALRELAALARQAGDDAWAMHVEEAVDGGRPLERITADALERWGGKPTTHSGTRPPQTVTGVLRREGDSWTLAYDGRVIRLRATKGMQYLAELLRHPRRDLAATDLAGVRLAEPSAGPALDRSARDAYRRRLRELEAEHEDATAAHDAGQAQRASDELEFLRRELSAAVGLGGRDRVAGSVAEKARLNVTRAIHTVLRKIAADYPTLGAHLEASIHTGAVCAYRPDPLAEVHWEL